MNRIADPIDRLRYLRHAARRSSNRKTSLAFVGCLALVLLPRPLARHIPVRLSSPEPDSPANSRVWLVESADDHEIYSNGLRIEDRYRTGSLPRTRYRAFPRAAAPPVWRSAPSGIVFHTTESDPAPFVEDRNPTLLRQSEGTLAYVRARRAYHFLIDRFGRVFRVVPESQIAFHAGESVWADARFLYVDLNASFLGVAFDTRTGAEPRLTPAQIAAGKALIQMLRSRYGVPAEDCVTHAQVSVNPGNHEAGWHTDFASEFPFAAMDLPDNYALPPASLYAAGFDYNLRFLRAAGPGMLRGVDLAEGMLHREATARGLSDRRYRKLLEERYQTLPRSLP